MKVRFTWAAHQELSEAMAFYEEQQTALGNRFLAEVESAVTRVEKYPETWAQISPRLRRCLVHRFPFALFYHVGSDEIQIVAVADLRRDPQRWEHIQ